MGNVELLQHQSRSGSFSVLLSAETVHLHQSEHPVHRALTWMQYNVLQTRHGMWVNGIEQGPKGMACADVQRPDPVSSNRALSCTCLMHAAHVLRHVQGLTKYMVQVDEERYAESLTGPNMNREDFGASATNVDDALSVLSFDGSEKEDRHPER